MTGTPPYRHVIWDWNGTLLDDAWLCLAILNRLLRERGMPPVSEMEYQEQFAFPVERYYRQLGFDFARESFESLSTAFFEEYDVRRHECALREGAREALAFCRDAGLAQSILSAYQQAALEEMLDHFRLREFFTAVAGLEDHYAGSKEASGRRLMERLPVAPGEVLLIGDTTHDFEVAQALGTGCALIPSGHNAPAKLAACGVPLLASPLDVRALLR